MQMVSKVFSTTNGFQSFHTMVMVNLNTSYEVFFLADKYTHLKTRISIEFAS